MVVRATSDIHLSASTAHWGLAALAALRDDAASAGGATVIVGDVFDQAETVHMPTWNRLRDELRAWPGEIWVLVGNHDQYPGGRSCLEGLHDPGRGIYVVDRPLFTPAGPMAPYVKPVDFAAAAAEAMAVDAGVIASAPRLFWCHAGFRGAYMNAMHRDRDGVSNAATPAGFLTVAGHYHMPQNLGPLIYCGSPYETSFAEEGQRKGWLRWADPMADNVPVRIGFGDLGAPRHVTVQWDPEAGPPPVPTGIAPTDRVRVVTRATRRRATECAKQLEAVGLLGASVSAVPETAAGRGVVAAGDPRGAAESYTVTQFVAGAGRGADPAAMERFAEEHKLWGA